MNKKKVIKMTAAAVLAVSVLIMAVQTYIGNYYHADAYELETQTVEETKEYLTYGEPDSGIGLIFYPGAKVEEAAYAPLMDALAKDGIFCVTVRMPARLAVLKPDAAKAVMQTYREVGEWYLAGHSLGGAMAADFAAGHGEELSGLILLAAYPTKEIGKLPVLSVYGSEDQVLNRDKYAQSIGLAHVLTERVIEGGNHAGFGNYGVQKGDGEALISTEEQWQETVDYILNYIRDNRDGREEGAGI